MLKEIFGILDLLFGLSFIALYFDFPKFFLLFLFALFLIKTLSFLPNIASIIDFVGGAFFLIALFGNFSAFTWIFAVWFLQKGVLSFDFIKVF